MGYTDPSQLGQESTLVLLRRIIKGIDSLSTVDSAQRQRIILDAITASLTLATVTTVGTVSSVTNVAAQTGLAGMDREMYINQARMAYAGIRSRITQSLPETSPETPVDVSSLATESSLTYLRRIVKEVESLGVVDSATRQRVVLDAITASLTLATVTTVGTVSSVTNVAAQTGLAGMDREMYINQARNAYSGIRSRLQPPEVATGVTSVSGTAGRITSTGGLTPVIDIDATYVGQTSITTLGTITTGTWDASTILATRGGTGQSTYTVGDLLQGAATNTLSKLASVSAGSYLRTGGVGAASTWSTVKLPDTMSALGLWVANSANTTVNLTAAANQSIRVNSGGTAWEAYTPTSGTVTASGPPSDNQIAVWTTSTNIEGASSLTYDGTILTATGRFRASDGVARRKFVMHQAADNDYQFIGFGYGAANDGSITNSLLISGSSSGVPIVFTQGTATTTTQNMGWMKITGTALAVFDWNDLTTTRFGLKFTGGGQGAGGGGMIEFIDYRTSGGDGYDRILGATNNGISNSKGHNMQIKAGAGSATNADGGDIEIASGAGIGTGVAGIVKMFSNNTERFRIADNGAWGLAGANYGTSTHVLTSNGSGSAPTWQAVYSGSDAWKLTGTSTLTGDAIIAGSGSNSVNFEQTSANYTLLTDNVFFSNKGTTAASIAAGFGINMRFQIMNTSGVTSTTAHTGYIQHSWSTVDTVSKFVIGNAKSDGLNTAQIEFWSSQKIYFAHNAGSGSTMVLTSTGLRIGSSSDPSYVLDVTGDQKINTGALGVNVNPNATDGRIDASNDIVAFSSDRRLKTGIRLITDPLEKIKRLTGFTFNWNDLAHQVAKYDRTLRHVGVYAQDVQSILPEAVKLAPFDNDGHDRSISGESYLTVQYEKLVPLLIEGMKEQQRQIEDMKLQMKLAGL